MWCHQLGLVEVQGHLMVVVDKIKEETMNVKIYSTPTCFYCVAAKEYFDKHDISYEDVDVSADREAAKEMIEKTGQQGVPVIQIGEETIVGFNKAEVNRLLNITEE